MALTIKQALQQGLSAHKDGKLKDAERLYRAILQSEPLHPDANHNLGVIAVSVKKPDVALSLFKTALEANPKIDQFWLSYIGALIKTQQIENAEQIVQQAKTQGVDEEKLNVLEERLALIARAPKSTLSEQEKRLKLAERRKNSDEKKKSKKAKKNLETTTPPKERLTCLLDHYQNRRFSDAEKLSVNITQQFPQHQFAWKVLGAIYRQSGRTVEAEKAQQISIALSPQDAEAHNNLGVTLQELDQLNKAEVSYTQAIALKPDYAEAHYNLGNMLQAQGRLDETEASYNQAIALNPDHAEAHNNLGITLKALGRLDEAEASYTQAIALNPDYPEAHYNLANTLDELGRLDDALASYTQAIALKPDFAEAHSNLGITLQELGRFGEAEERNRQAIALNSNYAEAHSNLGVTLQELGRLDEATASYRQAIVLKPDYADAHERLLTCLFQQDKKSVFFDKLDYLIDQNKASAITGSLTCRSALKYELEKPNLFCAKPLSYVLHDDLSTRYDFEKIFVEKAKSILNENQVSNRRQSLLVHGNQTLGNIFEIKSNDTSEIQNIIRSQVDKYLMEFKESEEGFIKNMPTEYSLYGWLISMKSGGNLKPHIHTEGWLSGSIYINVPRKLKGDSGNLVVSLGKDNDTTDTRINEKKIINVVTGSMVLFPASLMHHTIPFESEEERIVLAFDVKKSLRRNFLGVRR